MEALKSKKLSDFTVEDLRLMIGQGYALQYLVPLALDFLLNDPFAAGDYYEGDLLVNVLGCDTTFWRSSPALRKQMDQVVIMARSNVHTLETTEAIRHLINTGSSGYEANRNR